LSVKRFRSLLAREVLDWTHCINKLLEVELCISIKVYSADDGQEKNVIREYAAFYQESLKVNLIDVFVVPVVNNPEQHVQAIVISACQLLFKMLFFASKFKLLVDKTTKVLLNIIGQKLIGCYLISLSLGSLCS